MANLMFPIAEEDLYPLTQLARIEMKQLSSVVSELLRDWIRREALQLYADGKVSLLKLADILGISA